MATPWRDRTVHFHLSQLVPVDSLPRYIPTPPATAGRQYKAFQAISSHPNLDFGFVTSTQWQTSYTIDTPRSTFRLLVCTMTSSIWKSCSATTTSTSADA